MTVTAFPSGPRTFSLGPGAVHVWLGELHNCDGRWQHLLCPEEYRTAEEIVLADERRRFLAARGVLRHLLGRYLDCSGAKLTLVRLPSGKPVLRRPPGARQLAFSVSHSASRIAIALARHEPLGVDIERVRDVPALVAIERWLSAVGEEPLRAVPPSAARRALFRSWARREARSKALGFGVATRQSERPPGVRVRDLSVGRGYAGAVCLGSPSARVECFTLPTAAGTEGAARR